MLYDYKCETCGTEETRSLTVATRDGQRCEACGNSLSRVFSVPQVVVIGVSEDAIQHTLAVGSTMASKEKSGELVRVDTSDYLNSKPFGKSKLAAEMNTGALSEYR